MKEKYDVVVIGGGAAGLSGAVALSRARLSVLVVDAGAPRNASADHVHNYLAREGTPPADLLAAGRAELAGYGGEVITGTVTSAAALTSGPESDSASASVPDVPAPAGLGFRVSLADGRTVSARRLLVTTGLVDELPQIPGVAELWGSDVLHCPYCHGWEIRDRAIGILATGPLAMHQALLFRQLSADVTLFQHTAPPLDDTDQEKLAARGIPLIEGEVTALDRRPDGRLAGVRLRSGELIARDTIVVQPRFTARSEVLATLGLEPITQELNGHVIGSFIPTDPTGATAVPGVWAAGNVTDLRAQVITSAGAGLNAGATINADLVDEDTRQAVATLRATPQLSTTYS